jgi:hypothetical protein
MSPGKINAQRAYPPDYVSVDTLAYRLDCTVAEVEALLRSGGLPGPMQISGLRRWDFGLVRATIYAQNSKPVRVGRNGQPTAADDPYLAGVERGQTG